MPSTFLRRLLALGVLTILLAVPATGFAAKLALVVGNAQYASLGTLANTRRDADSFGGFLSASGFSVTSVSDASAETLSAAVDRFAQTLGPGDVAVFYFAGHAVLSKSTDYLVGTDAQLQQESDIATQAVALTDVIGRIAGRAGFTMAFIDAARGERLIPTAARSAGGQGFGANALVMFATAPGQIAYDGIDGHSLFTSALLRRLPEDGAEIRTAFQHVVEDIGGSTFAQQTPQLFSGLSNDFYFRPGGQQVAVNPPVTPPATPTPAPAPQTPSAQPPAPAVKPPDSPETAAKADFDAAQRMATVRGWLIFLFRYPADGDITTNAKQRLQQVYDAEKAGEDLLQAEAELELTPEGLQAVQQALNVRGLNAGEADGKVGRATRNAIQALQRANGRSPTGYIDPVVLALLGVQIATATDALPPGRPARTYAAADLMRLEGDPRLSSAVRCLGNGEIDYGFFGGHLYVALARGLTYAEAAQQARRCGGYLASITSKAENDFVMSVIDGDPAFFQLGQNEDGAWIGGPNFGLKRERNTRDPKSGWVWDSGEPVKYANWAEYQPDNFQGVENVGGYWQEVPRNTKIGPNTAFNGGWNDSQDGESAYIYEFP